MDYPKVVYSDFDGTLTEGHFLSPLFFEVLDHLEKSKTPLIITTGRSLSWGHFFLTHFPLSIVITEGGGSISYKKDDQISDEHLVPQESVERLEKMTKELLYTFPQVELSIDSKGRVTDRAIELYTLADMTLRKEVENFLQNHQVKFSCSNVHLNFWVGEIDKFFAIKMVHQKFFSTVSLDECLYFGDSLNDQSVFKSFPRSVGVANIENVMALLKHRPKIILKGKENNGIKGVKNYLFSLEK